ncbi:MAG TPA: carboxylesterase [Micromonosporaceae bacterium]|nr:carboxylesterase [Micromonosporaceae bacterium]
MNTLYRFEDQAATPVVDLGQGALLGAWEGGLAIFRGVPYATPPLGDLRWRPAQPHPGWSGIRDATAYGPSAPQPHGGPTDAVLGGHGEPPFDEDCLTLNVWTPGLDDARRSVYVWIHGGGFVSGSGSMPNYAGDTFASNGDVVVVSINYRLGALGFLHFGGAGNFWLSDQIMALRWVREHIAAFGGNPDDITVGGQSGGAYSTAALAVHPASSGLFRRSILQSPPCGLVLADPAEAMHTTAMFLDVLGVGDVEQARKVPWPKLVEATIAMFGLTAKWGYWLVPFLPVLDGESIAADPFTALRDGARDDLDMLLGWTAREASFAFGLHPGMADATEDRVLARAADTFKGRAADVYAAYALGRKPVRPIDVLIDFVSDELFRVPGDELAQARAARGRPAWVYQFDLRSPAHDGRLGATHCLDLPFTFHNIERWAHAPFIAGIAPQTSKRLAEAMHRAWISFIRTGDPNHTGLPSWEPYTADTRTVMSFDSAIAPVSDPIGDRRLWYADQQ